MGEDVLSIKAALTAHPLFAACTPVEIERLCRVATNLQVEAGYVFTRAGRRGYELFLVLEGTATSAADGAPTHVLGPGGHFGADRSPGARTSLATVVAASSMHLLALDAREVDALLAIRPEHPVATTPTDVRLAGAEG